MSKIEIKGMDISTHQKEVDWKAVKNDGVKYVILRAGFGDGNQDAMFTKHIKGALDVGLDVGIYWFLYPTSVDEARNEAKKCLKIIESYKGKINYPIYADYEYDSDRYAKEQGVNVTKDFRTDCIVAFCEEIENAGYYAGWYANLDYIRNKVDMSRLERYDLWLADYTGGPNYTCGMQQFTSSGKVDGITGEVDMNTAFYDYPRRLAEKGCNFLEKKENAPSKPNNSKPTTTNKSVNVIYKVRTTKGKWLPEVKNLEDYAGLKGYAITDVAMKVDKGSIKYRVHVKDGSWLNWITKYNTNDTYGYAGNGKPIDCVEVYYYTPDDIRPYKRAWYRVSPVNKDYYDWQKDTLTTNGMDGYAGAKGVKIDRFQIQIKED